VQRAQDYYPECPEAFLVSLARAGDRKAFEALVQRRQSSIRNLMRRFSGDCALADDLAQQVFLKVWLNIRALRKPSAFSAWLRQLAVSVWLQYVRKKDALRGAGELSGTEAARRESSASVGMDLDLALATLPEAQRLPLVLSYHEGLTHSEIAEMTGSPLGTVKSQIRNGALRLREVLGAYASEPETNQT
jgi:RNA polymerase sigma-70 factor (ECF subfamily)